jgi:2-polyprenyl-3-methyl-5-hydroxy-6-metoxy-1,4-benzoquinol methylase
MIIHSREEAVEIIREINEKGGDYHQLDLGDGLVLKGHWDMGKHLRYFDLPQDLTGKTVLDIGCNTGFFSFECEKRGAARVVALDVREIPAFFAARKILDSKVEFIQKNIYDIAPGSMGSFDFVLCGSLLLHLTDMFQALRIIGGLTREVAVISTEICLDERVRNEPFNRFVAKRYPEWVGFGNHIAVFWHPTVRCLSDMFIEAGFAEVEEVSQFRLENTQGGFAEDVHVVLKAYVRKGVKKSERKEDVPVDKKELSVEEIKERIVENLKRDGRENEISPTPLTSAGISGFKQRPALGVLESFLWNLGTRFAAMIKRIPLLNFLSEKVYFRLLKKQTMAPAGSSGNEPPPSRDSLNIETMWNYDVFLKALEQEGFKGKVKRSVFNLIGFYAWWQSQINRELLRLMEEERKQLHTLFQNDDSIRGLAHLSLEKIKGLYQNDEDIRGMATLGLKKIEQFQDSLNAVTGRIFETIGDLGNNVRHLHQTDMEAMGKLRETLNSVTAHLTELAEKMDGFKMESAYLDKKLGIINHELKQHGTIKTEELMKELPRISLDEMRYLSFENKYRGSRKDIKERQRQYVDLIAKAKEQNRGDGVLDVGCGRGEFLELLAEKGIPAKGVDTNEGMIETCRTMGLDVYPGDAIEFLATLPDSSLIGITAFQVVEHLPVEYLKEFIKTCFYKMQNKGVIILETVNPYSVLAMKFFWMDLSHVRPIPPETLKFLLDTAGFRNIEVTFTSPVPEELKLKGSSGNTKVLNDLLFGDQDYAVIGWK